jgi:hypothetical protein
METKLPYEIHVTVKSANMQRFKDVCSLINVKPIVIDLMKEDTVVLQDVMTSSKIKGTYDDAQKASVSIAKELSIAGFEVQRIKIETVPWHPEAPSFENEKTMRKGNYFESHVQVITTAERKDLLKEIAKKMDAHLSRNYFKKLSNGQYIIMLTLRDSATYFEKFSLRNEVLKTFLEAKGFEYKKVEVEYAIYDTKQSHDSIWISN